MQLPAQLQYAINQLLDGENLVELSKASERLSMRYRAELRDGNMHLDKKSAALAYLAARLPATYAAVYAALCHTLDVMPDFAPANQLDVGAGPATAVLAAHQLFSSLKGAVLVEQSEEIRKLGQYLISQTMDFAPIWENVDVTRLKIEDISGADLVTLAYVLDELEPDEQNALVDRLWQKTEHVLLIVEPGTPAGWNRLMEQRRRLIADGGFIIAPCPHPFDCPVQPPDWCHFSQRVERSRTHRLTKHADAPYEDEKYCYVALSKKIVNLDYYRVLNQPRRSSGKVNLSLCLPNGQQKTEIVTKKNKECYIRARKSSWGSKI